VNDWCVGMLPMMPPMLRPPGPGMIPPAMLPPGVAMPPFHPPASQVKSKFHYADFHQNFPAGKVVHTIHLDMSRCL